MAKQLSGKSFHIFFDDVSQDLGEKIFEQFTVLRNLKDVELIISQGSNAFVLGIGNPVNRKILSEKFIEIGGVLTTLMSPFARVGHFKNHIGDGSTIMTGVVMTNNINLGKGSLINLNCTIGHDCVIDEFVEMSPGTHISGNCKIGSYCVFGTNSTVLPKVTIGKNVVVGAGSVVTKDIPDNSLVVGVPAKIIKQLPELKF